MNWKLHDKEQQKSSIFVRYLKLILKNLHIIWKFSRPHTVIGTCISVFALFFLSNHANSLVMPWNFTTFTLTIISCVACNVYITGLNQIYDVDIDRENKPNLPLVTQELSMVDAKKIVIFALMISLVFSYFQNLFFGGLVTGIAIIGSLYTIPPVRLKRYHFWAATAIALVRGPLINIGIYIHFYVSKYGLPINFNPKIALLTVFITAFSVGIAWFKDIPDVDGDKNNNINPYTIKFKYDKQNMLKENFNNEKDDRQTKIFEIEKNEIQSTPDFKKKIYEEYLESRNNIKNLNERKGLIEKETKEILILTQLI